MYKSIVTLGREFVKHESYSKKERPKEKAGSIFPASMF
jgi:hypothetical protein